jgi:hypothetical protein
MRKTLYTKQKKRGKECWESKVCRLNIRIKKLELGAGIKPVILATQEAVIRRVLVWSQPRQIVYKTISQKNPSQKRAGVGPEFKPQYGKNKTKQNKTPAIGKYSGITFCYYGLFIYLFIYLFYSAGDQTQRLTHARQVLYHWVTPPHPQISDYRKWHNYSKAI